MESEMNDVYCKCCTGCGEDGCCSYLGCIREAVIKNKDCRYTKTYLFEVYLRHNFYKQIFKEFGNDIRISKVFDEAYSETKEDMKKIEL